MQLRLDVVYYFVLIKRKDLSMISSSLVLKIAVGLFYNTNLNSADQKPHPISMSRHFVFFVCFMLGMLSLILMVSGFAHAANNASQSQLNKTNQANLITQINERTIERLNPIRRAELIALVRQDCGSCHGLTLKGGLGPALLPSSLKDKPVESLHATVFYGRPGTAMPPWNRFLSEAETTWIVTQLLKGFPDEK